MTSSTYTRPYVTKDAETYRRTDSDKDSKATVGPAFVIALANHKGGVTKTTSTANLGACLAETGRTVLVVDSDPQANLSEAFGWTEDLPGERLEDLLTHPDAATRLQPPTALQSDVAPELGWRSLLRIIPLHRRPGRRRG